MFMKVFLILCGLSIVSAQAETEDCKEDYGKNALEKNEREIFSKIINANLAKRGKYNAQYECYAEHQAFVFLSSPSKYAELAEQVKGDVLDIKLVKFINRGPWTTFEEFASKVSDSLAHQKMSSGEFLYGCNYVKVNNNLIGATGACVFIFF